MVKRRNRYLTDTERAEVTKAILEHPTASAGTIAGDFDIDRMTAHQMRVEVLKAACAQYLASEDHGGSKEPGDVDLEDGDIVRMFRALDGTWPGILDWGMSWLETQARVREAREDGRVGTVVTWPLPPALPTHISTSRRGPWRSYNYETGGYRSCDECPYRQMSEGGASITLDCDSDNGGSSTEGHPDTDDTPRETLVSRDGNRSPSEVLRDPVIDIVPHPDRPSSKELLIQEAQAARPEPQGPSLPQADCGTCGLRGECTRQGQACDNWFYLPGETQSTRQSPRRSMR